MTYIFQAILVVGFIGLLFFFCARAIDDGSLLDIIAAVSLIVILVAGIFKLSSEEEAKGPCIKYETHYSYNSATKTNMPYRVCTERGEWVK